MTCSARWVLAIAAALVAMTSGIAAEEPCHLELIGTADVAAVRDGRTLLLRDGGELRLAGIETSGADEARTALAALALGKTLTLKRLGPVERDRYGRLVAFAFPPDSTQSLQQTLLEQGMARVSARVGDKDLCHGFVNRRTRGKGCRSRALGRSKFRPFAS